jgi:transposase
MSDYGVYPSDVSDEQWAFVASYLCLVKEDSPQRKHPVRAGFNALRKDGARRGALEAFAHQPAALADCPPAEPALAAGGGV